MDFFSFSFLLGYTGSEKKKEKSVQLGDGIVFLGFLLFLGSRFEEGKKLKNVEVVSSCVKKRRTVWIGRQGADEGMGEV